MEPTPPLCEKFGVTIQKAGFPRYGNPTHSSPTATGVPLEMSADVPNTKPVNLVVPAELVYVPHVPHREIVLDRDLPRLSCLSLLTTMRETVGLVGAGPPGVPGNTAIGLAGTGPVGVPGEEGTDTLTLAFMVRETVVTVWEIRSLVQQFGQNTSLHDEVPWLS